MNRNAARRSFFAAFARLIGVALGAAAGSWLGKFGFEISNGLTVIIFLVVAFFVMWFSEYERVN